MATRFDNFIKKSKTVEGPADWMMDYLDCDTTCPVMDCAKMLKDCKANLIKYLNSEEPKSCASCKINFGEVE